VIVLNLVGFDIYSSEVPTNKELIITYKKDSNTVNYSYKIIKDEQIYEENYVNDDITFTLKETGIYKIEVTTYDNLGVSNIIESGNYIIDKESPVINAKRITMVKGENIDILKGVKAVDNMDGDITSNIKTNIEEIDLNKIGNNNLIYTVSDQAGNQAIKTINLEIIKNQYLETSFIRIIILVLFLCFMFLIYKYNRIIKLEKRLGKYSISSLKGNEVAIYDEIKKEYLKIIDKISDIIGKSVFIERYSKRFNKYIMVVNNDFDTPKKFVANKIIVAFAIVLLSLFINTLKLETISIIETFIPFVFGFFLPDIIYLIKYKMHRKKIENDLLQAIIIMNNAFKSGRSILQAIELVTKELDGAIGKEFKKMYMELTLGLDIETVFNRFSERIDLEEVTYLTASLSILNKSGGNIIKVFSSIEDSLFNKKKLKLELNSLTGSSKMIVIALFLVPILFLLFISIINPEYFKPLISTQIGWILIGIMIIYYIIYIICVRKIMKVRM